MANDFYGKFRGVVQDNSDPMGIARLEVSAPAVLGERTMAWAMPCLSFPDAGFALPPVGANVWVEFEQGDPGLPIWTGCFWLTAADMPQP